MPNDREPRINQSTTTSGVPNGNRHSSRPDQSRKPSGGATQKSGSGTEDTDGGAPSRQNSEAGSKSGQL